LLLKYKDGEKKVVVPPTATIAMFSPGEKAEVKPGVAVAITAVAKPDGTFETARVGVGRDGFAPN
jgi:nicotinamide mononucleotide (NMN) deamidase PncC